jgi:membrane protease YdiL (CAAX protease family)
MMSIFAARRLPTFLCLGLTLAYPMFSVPVQGSVRVLSVQVGELPARTLTEGAIWCYAALVLAVALFWERRSPASLGIQKPTWSSVRMGIAGALAIAVAGALAGYLVDGVLHAPVNAEAQAASLTRGSVGYAICLAVRAGVIEETLFRGLAIEQLAALTGKRWLAASAAAMAFTALHALRFEWVQLIPIGAISIILTVLYVWRHDLLTNIIAHVVVDGIGLVVLAMHASRLQSDYL